MLSIFSAIIAYNLFVSVIFSDLFEGCFLKIFVELWICCSPAQLNRVVTGPRNPGVISDRGSGSFSRESEFNCYILFTLSCCTKSRSLLDLLFCKFAFYTTMWLGIFNSHIIGDFYSWAFGEAWGCYLSFSFPRCPSLSKKSLNIQITKSQLLPGIECMSWNRRKT